MLPFTPEVFFSNLAHYNAEIWPAQIIAYGLGFAAIVLLFMRTAWSSPLIAALLSAAWMWIGAVYHLRYFATINVAAPLFGIAFVAQGILFAWTGVITRRVTFRFKPGLAAWVGLALAAIAMVVYPFLGWLAGHGWPQAPVFGVAPCPTTIFTMGLLLLTHGRTPLHLAIIPVVWSLIGGTAVWLLDVPEDILLPLAGVGGLWLIFRKNRAAA